MKYPHYFYKATDEYNTYEKHVNAPLIRKKYELNDVKSAEVLISGLGFYDLYAGGKKVTKGLLAPYISNPDDIVYFDRIDVTKNIEKGVLVLGIVLGNGMRNAHGGRVWDFDIARFRNAPCFALSLTVTGNDGTVTVYEADESYKTHPSPILFDDLRSGCFYDANLETDGWLLPEFDDSSWNNVKKAEMPRGGFRICEAEPIVITKEIRPVKVYKEILCEDFYNRENMRLDTQFKFDFRGKQGVVFDFGVNTAGIFRLKIDGKKGQKIFIQMCEFATDKGQPSYVSTGSFYPDGYGQTAYYVAKGGKNEIFEPSFCYFGYRYAVVFGLEDDQIKNETLTMLVANSDLKERSTMSCSDEIMNRLIEMGRVSDLANFYYFPTDCPHREKNGWTGDASVSCEHTILRYTPENSYREWLRNIVAAQSKEGALPGIIPTGGWGFDWGNGPAWDNVLTELCYQMYRMRDDLSAALECRDAMLRYLSYISSKRDENGLICTGLGDWVQPGKYADQPTTPVYFTDTLVTFFIAKKSAELFGRMNLPNHMRFAVSLACELREAIRRQLIDFSTMTAIPATQTAQALCMYFGAFEPGEMALAGKRLVEIVHRSDDHIDCGMIGLRIIFHVLSDIGEGNLAYKMITRTDFPSYGMFTKGDMTALPETFLDESRRNNPDSLNHHFLGDYTSWFLQRVVGIRVNPRNISANNFDITPDFVGNLEYADGSYEAPCGRVSVSWKKLSEGKYEVQAELPEGASGYVKCPSGFVFRNEQNACVAIDNSTAAKIACGKTAYIMEKK